MNYFKFLFEEITIDILSRLPTELVLQCKLVCTNWRSFVRHPLFSRMHFHRLNQAYGDSGKLGFIALTDISNYSEKLQYFEYNEHDNQSTSPIERITRMKFTPPFKDISFVGSCNGLVCFNSYKGTRPVCICNPVTKEFVMLPQLKTDQIPTTGFGYVSSTNEYKVVGICMYKYQYVQVYVYTLGSGNGWRDLGNFSFECEGPLGLHGFFANGALYFNDGRLGKILTFDLSKEKVCENLSPPPLPPDDSYWPWTKIGVLDGFLFFAILQIIEGARYIDTWLLRKKNNDHDIKELEEHQSWVWNKEFRTGGINLFAVTKSGCLLTYDANHINIYDTKASTSKPLVEFQGPFSEIYSHKNTLVSLKELGEEDAKIMG